MSKLTKIHNLINETSDNAIKSQELDIFNIFESNNIFTIKEFQRKYEWTKLQISELIKELELHKKDISYFLGMIILKKEKIESNLTNLSIIDGQQRITTLFLILKSLEKNIKKFNFEDYKEIKFDINIIEILKNTYSNNTGEVSRLKISDLRGEDELKNILIENNIDDEYNQTNNNKNPIYTQAFNSINNIFKEKTFQDLIKFYEKIKLIKFSLVILGPKINEYKVFEDLNSKGVDLKIDDLIRNFFAQKAVSFSLSDIQKTIDVYEQFLNQVEIFLKIEKNQFRGFFSNQIGRWFKNYILYKLNSKKTFSDTNDKRMYSFYKEEMEYKITKGTDLMAEIQNIKYYLDFCMWMNGKSNYLYLANDIDMYPIFFEFFKNALLKSYDMNKLKKIFALIYLTVICSGESMKNFNKLYLEKVKTLFFQNNFFNEAYDEIKKLFKYNDENTSQFIMKKISEDSVIWNEPKMQKFILFFFGKMIEHSTGKKIMINDDSFNIEHIIPQSPQWSAINNEKEKEEKINLWFINVNRLKNLALIEASLNQQLGNHFYQKKKSIFNSLKTDVSFLETTNEVFSYVDFGEKELELRFKKIKEFAEIFIKDIIKIND